MKILKFTQTFMYVPVEILGYVHVNKTNTILFCTLYAAAEAQTYSNTPIYRNNRLCLISQNSSSSTTYPVGSPSRAGKSMILLKNLNCPVKS